MEVIHEASNESYIDSPSRKSNLKIIHENINNLTNKSSKSLNISKTKIDLDNSETWLGNSIKMLNFKVDQLFSEVKINRMNYYQQS